MGMLARLTSSRRNVAVAALLILAVAAGVRFYNIGWAFSTDGIDEGIMLERAIMIDRGLAPYTSLPLDQAPLGMLAGAEIWGSVVTLRAFSAAISVAAVGACMEAARRIKGNTAMLVTDALLALDFAFLRENRLFSLNSLSSSFLAISILLFVMYVQKGSRPALLAAGLMTGVATSMKLFGVLGLLAMLLFIGYEQVRRADTRRKGAADMVLLSAFAALPVGALMFYLGPSDMIQGMLFDQGHRAFEPFQKLSFLAYFGTNVAYLLPLAAFGRQWKEGPERRFLLVATLTIAIFMLAQPLTYYHHLIMLSPALSILAGVFVASVSQYRKEQPPKITFAFRRKKGTTIWGLTEVALVTGLLVSSGLVAYGLATQGKPTQEVVAEKIAEITGPNDYLVCGDPTISAYANRPTPPSLINVAYARYPDLTLEEVETGILEYRDNVTVVVLAYRLGNMQGLPEFLESNGYTEVSRDFFGYGDDVAIYTFNRAIEPFTFYVRDDVVAALSLPVSA